MIETILTIAGYLFLIAAVCVICFIKGMDYGEGTTQKQALEAGVAHYDPKTGKFTWGSPECKEGVK